MDGSFNVALTTNFDDLISDALYLFTTSRPLVIQHESLSDYIRPTRTRPLIVKLHGDHRLSALNTAQETKQLKESINRAVKALLQDHGLVFLGYGGADQGILTMLEELSDEALPFGVFWVSSRRPEGKVGEWIEKRKGTWVEHDDFDKLTMLMRSEFGLSQPDSNRFNEVFRLYADDYSRLTNAISLLGDTTPGTLALKEAARRTEAMIEGPWAPLFEGRRLRNTDPDQALVVYEQGVEQYPDFLPLVSDFATFLSSRNHPRAEELHQRALNLAPDDPVVIGNYAIFLAYEKNDLGQAEELFLRAIGIAPDNSSTAANYTAFLFERRKDPDRAEQILLRTLDRDPYHPQTLGMYANFLAIQRRDYDSAVQLFLRALAIEPNNAHNFGNFAGLLLAMGNQQLGLEMLNRAIAALPTADDPRLIVELWFYVYAHGVEMSRASALSTLRSILEQGNRSMGWDLSRNVERACMEGHPECAWLEQLAKVITGNVDISVLATWPAWQSAGAGDSTA
jgi:tetratricopeptide (TPR) repeat protein